MGWTKSGNPKANVRNSDFTADKPDEFPPFWPGHSCGSDPPEDYVAEIIVKMPLDDIQSVERPQIELLPAMKSESLLMWR